MAQIVLIRPGYGPETDFAIIRESRPPTGLLYVAAPVVEAGYTVAIIDQSAEPDWREAIKRSVGPETICIGITSLTGFMIQNGINVVTMVRELSPCPVVWGGVHPTLETATTIASPHVDIIVKGQGEETFLELVNALSDHRPLDEVDGIVFKRDGEVIRTRARGNYDLNKLPRLPLEIVNLEYYRSNFSLKRFFRFRAPIALSLETSRGCTHKCTYCVDASEEYASRSKWWGMSVEKILGMVEQIKRDFGIRAFAFIDDNFFANPRRARQFVDELERRELDIEWFAEIRLDTIVKKFDVPFLKKMERTGLRSIGVGLESGSDRMLEFIRKGETRETYVAANRMLAQTGILVQYGIIQGMPTETVEDAEQSYTLVAELMRDNPNAAPALNKLIPNPGTPMIDECVKHGFKKPDTFEGWIPYSDVKWSHGATEWMDPRTADFIMSQRHYKDILTMATAEPNRSAAVNLIYKSATALLLTRIRYHFYGLKIEQALHGMVRQPAVFRSIRSFYIKWVRTRKYATS